MSGEERSEKMLGRRVKGSSRSFEAKSGLEVERTYEYGYADGGREEIWRRWR